MQSQSINQPPPILVVDDVRANRLWLGRLLYGLCLDCEYAADGSEAVQKARSRVYSAILMDIEMQNLDGDAAARQIRGLCRTAHHVPIIAVTSLPFDEAVERCRIEFFDGIIAKPATPATVRAQLIRHVPELRCHPNLT